MSLHDDDNIHYCDICNHAAMVHGCTEERCARPEPMCQFVKCRLYGHRHPWPHETREEPPKEGAKP